MSITFLQLPSPILGLPARNGSAGRRARIAVACCKHNQPNNVQEARQTNSLTRRDALSFISSAFLATLLVANPAEAKTSKQENKRKVREKLEKLREKALGPNGKNGASNKEKESVANLLIPPTMVEASI